MAPMAAPLPPPAMAPMIAPVAAPPPMKTFLRQYDLKGKTVIPFNTNAGYGVGSSFETVKELSPGSKVLEGFELK